MRGTGLHGKPMSGMTGLFYRKENIMENKELNGLKEKYAGFIAGLSDEMKAKVDACKTVEEFAALADDYDGELPDDIAEAVAGGKSKPCSHTNYHREDTAYGMGFSKGKEYTDFYSIYHEVCDDCHATRDVGINKDGEIVMVGQWSS